MNYIQCVSKIFNLDPDAWSNILIQINGDIVTMRIDDKMYLSPVVKKILIHGLIGYNLPFGGSSDNEKLDMDKWEACQALSLVLLRALAGDQTLNVNNMIMLENQIIQLISTYNKRSSVCIIQIDKKEIKINFL